VPWQSTMWRRAAGAQEGNTCSALLVPSPQPQGARLSRPQGRAAAVSRGRGHTCAPEACRVDRPVPARQADLTPVAAGGATWPPEVRPRRRPTLHGGAMQCQAPAGRPATRRPPLSLSIHIPFRLHCIGMHANCASPSPPRAYKYRRQAARPKPSRIVCISSRPGS
jgi:hypothetical protein